MTAPARLDLALAGAGLPGHDEVRDSVVQGADRLLDVQRRRTRQFGHAIDPALPPPPPGALAGGANSIPAPDFPYDPRLRGLPPQCCYLDEPTSEVTNDVCVRWNAPLAWTAAYLSAQLDL